MTSGTLRSRSRAAAGLVFAAGLMVVSVEVRADSQPADRQYTAVGSANGMYAHYGIPGFVVVEDFIDGGGPSAQSLLSSDGTAQSFASLPYPGGTAVAGPSTLGGVTGVSNGLSYPFYVGASHPLNPEQELKDPSGAYHLAAKANLQQVAGSAQFRGQGGEGKSGGSGGAQAITSVVQDADKIAVRSETVNEALNLGGGALAIGLVHSESITTFARGDKEPKTQSAFVLEGGRAGDVSFSVGSEGLKAAQQGIPLPFGAGLAALNKALEPAKLAVRFEQSQPLTGGSSAGVFEVVSAAEVPGAGQGTLTLRFGGALSYISMGPAGSGGLADELGDSLPSEVGPGDSGAPPVTGTLSPATEPVPTPQFSTNGGGFAAAAGLRSPVSGGGFDAATAVPAPLAQASPVQAAAPPAEAALDGSPVRSFEVGSAGPLAGLLLAGALGAIALLGGWVWGRASA